MLTVALLAVMAVAISPRTMRLKLAGAIVLLAAMVLPLVPASTWNRLLTFTSVDTSTIRTKEDLEYAERAVGSTMARKDLQIKALRLTAYHPLFGVGPKMFADAVDAMVRGETKRKSSWQVSHNSYLQVSAETGIPGFIFYTWTIILCLKLNYRIYKQSLVVPALHDATLQSACLLLSTAAFAFGILFSSIAYDYHLAALVGFTAANYLATRDLLPKPAVVPPPARSGARLRGLRARLGKT
jgi:O-antigen ligase